MVQTTNLGGHRSPTSFRESVKNQTHVNNNSGDATSKEINKSVSKDADWKINKDCRDFSKYWNWEFGNRMWGFENIVGKKHFEKLDSKDHFNKSEVSNISQKATPYSADLFIQQAWVLFLRATMIWWGPGRCWLCWLHQQLGPSARHCGPLPAPLLNA